MKSTSGQVVYGLAQPPPFDGPFNVDDWVIPEARKPGDPWPDTRVFGATDSASGSIVRGLAQPPPFDGPFNVDDWVLFDGVKMPDSYAHRERVALLELILTAFVARTGRDALVIADLGCRWDRARPRVGVDPDVALVEPAPPAVKKLRTIRTWARGHTAPRFAVEVVSITNWKKDYLAAPSKYGLLGTRELVIFDPEREGPATSGGPFVLQVLRRNAATGELVRVYTGKGPVRSQELEAWLVVQDGGMLRIADKADGSGLWLTAAEEANAAAKKANATAKKANAAAKKANAAAKEKEAARRRMEGSLLEVWRKSVEDLCEAFGVRLNKRQRQYLLSLDAAGFEALRAKIKEARGWPLSHHLGTARRG